MRKRRGFTIVELVIVIAVIAVLAAVLIPTFSKITKNAEETTALADSKVSYEEYLANTLPENISKDLYVRVKNGYVHYIDGKAVKTNDSYVTTIDEYVEWIDRNGDYRPAFYIIREELANLFIADYNEYNNAQDIIKINEYYKHNMYASFWRIKKDSIDGNDNAEYVLKRWYWMFEFFNYLRIKQNNTALADPIEKLLREKCQDPVAAQYGYTYQNIALFFLKINADVWNEEYKKEDNENTKLAGYYSSLDFTNTTFGDYAPYIPYEEFTTEINNAKEAYLAS